MADVLLGQIAATCLALGVDRETLTAAELAAIPEGVEPLDTAAVRAGILSGEDPLGQAFCTARSAEERRPFGQTFCVGTHVLFHLLAADPFAFVCNGEFQVVFPDTKPFEAVERSCASGRG